MRKKPKLTSHVEEEIDRSDAWSSINLGVDDLEKTEENIVIIVMTGFNNEIKVYKEAKKAVSTQSMVQISDNNTILLF